MELKSQLTGQVQTTLRICCFTAVLLSTVLAQDRFFSVSLSFTLDRQDPQSHHDDVVGYGRREFHSGFRCGFDEQLGLTAF